LIPCSTRPQEYRAGLGNLIKSSDSARFSRFP
jgi:hypothetical protein